VKSNYPLPYTLQKKGEPNRAVNAKQRIRTLTAKREVHVLAYAVNAKNIAVHCHMKLRPSQNSKELRLQNPAHVIYGNGQDQHPTSCSKSCATQIVQHKRHLFVNTIPRYLGKRQRCNCESELMDTTCMQSVLLTTVTRPDLPLRSTPACLPEKKQGLWSKTVLSPS